MVKYLLLVTFVVACTSLSGVLGSIGCYYCNSYNDADHTACLDPMSVYVNTTACPDNYVCTRVSYVTQKTFVTSRGCDPAGDTCNNIYKTLVAYYPDLATFNCYYCTYNYCNSASGLQIERQLMKEEMESNHREKMSDKQNYFSV
ncbi:hypothetical protein GWI33_007309 [Rhynchophorus ferrugineus]|uniref:Protein quiver n=1 Tax=Rhynchophorus ferrugineus TaxID=354439 RepID=A0A834IEJ5_RHYFE|nr:hypothetical protein GWI33_007309 [Rhynchophorus ferrugineus]